MAIQRRKRAVGTFPNRQTAEEALSRLRDSGFLMDRVSVLAKDIDRNEQIAGATVKDKSDMSDRGDNEAQEGAGIGAVTGTALGGIGGLLVGLEALIIPGVGPFLAAGTIATTLAGAGIGAAAGGLVGALTGLGIPEEEARAYGQRVSQGEFLVIVDGSEDEINRAGSILRNQDIRDWAIYDVSGDVASADMNDIDRTTQRYTGTTTDEGVVEIVDKRNDQPR
ncbi:MULTISPECIES: general stress protein [Fischerella]|uniref:Signal transduction histidine kinase LytS n=1 Tax=Fischerella muscicola CCMEE 5323 TaxID=2019572 RepID=A0A2N6K0A5_FISMU|nr:general stress protein [Fischerella muscicola]MBD2434701.1 signal transduction histidine kinase LytS [Fischerella sp. FACHB-380]PLZ87387.1 signal transduction histidine kinase LytS [Fischerella muscicola CCMEE 5323]